MKMTKSMQQQNSVRRGFRNPKRSTSFINNEKGDIVGVLKTSTKLECGVGCLPCLLVQFVALWSSTWLEMDCWEAFDRARMLVMSGLTT